MLLFSERLHCLPATLEGTQECVFVFFFTYATDWAATLSSFCPTGLTGSQSKLDELTEMPVMSGVSSFPGC